MSDWQSIETYKPIEGKALLLYAPAEEQPIQIGRWTKYSKLNGSLYYGESDFIKATHWMDLPEEPNE